MRATLLLLAVFIALVCAQSKVDRLKIDDYETLNNNIVIILTGPASPSSPVASVNISSSGNPQDKNILGGERDLRYTATNGTAGRVFSTSVGIVGGSGQWEISTPNGGDGIVLMQWDSLDNSINLDPKGFLKITGTSAGLDLTEGGLGENFKLVIETDILTSYAINVYSPNGNKCTTSVSVSPTNGTPKVSTVNFSAFTGNCDFNNVGAIEIVVSAFENVDTIVTLFTTQGQPDPVTPSITSSPSISNTPSKGASPSPSPSNSPAPSVVPATECFCQCPAFTCELIFDVDDDNNHALFFVDDDGFAKSKAYFGGYGYYFANGQGQSGSASTLVASVATVMAAFLAFF